jgi:hypothetical protein
LGKSYIFLDLPRNTLKLRLVRDVAPVVRDTPGLSVLEVPHVQHRHGSAAHAVDLCDEQTKATRASGDDNDLILEVDVAGETEGHALVDLA